MASPVSGERIRLNADIGGARLSASPDAINFLDTIPRVGALPLARPGVFGGVSCAPIHLNAAEVATPSCLTPPGFEFPRTAGATGFPFFPIGCSHKKLELAYIRAYRMLYWGFATMNALSDPALPWQVRDTLWGYDYASAVPETAYEDPDVGQELRAFVTENGYNSRFNARNFFGGYTSDRLTTIRNNLLGTWKRLLPGAPKFTFIHGKCDWWMNIDGDKKTIHICPDHFRLSSVTLMASSIAHEFMHGVGVMNDQVLGKNPAVTQYFPFRARALAQYHLSLALKNNDNYTFWLYGMYFAWVKNCNLFGPLKEGGKTYSFDMKNLKWIIK